jgi:hypothetical protein
MKALVPVVLACMPITPAVLLIVSVISKHLRNMVTNNIDNKNT